MMLRIGPRVMAYKPHYDLNEVKKAIDVDCSFPARRRSINAVIAVYRMLGKEKSNSEAEQFIKDQIKLLSDEDFSGHVSVHGAIADVYGKYIDNESWYIKFHYSESEGVVELSFHPPEWDMTLKNGKIIKTGNMTYEQKSNMWRVRK